MPLFAGLWGKGIYLHYLTSSLSRVVLCREIVDHPFITEIPINAFRGITSNVLTL